MGVTESQKHVETMQLVDFTDPHKVPLSGLPRSRASRNKSDAPLHARTLLSFTGGQPSGGRGVDPHRTSRTTACAPLLNSGIVFGWPTNNRIQEEVGVRGNLALDHKTNV